MEKNTDNEYSNIPITSSVTLNHLSPELAFLKELWTQTPPPPCEGCPFAKRCADEHLACLDFYKYVEGGTFPKKSIRRPNPTIYEKIFVHPLGAQPDDSDAKSREKFVQRSTKSILRNLGKHQKISG